MRKFLVAVVGALALLLSAAVPASATEEPFVAKDTALSGVQSDSEISTVSADLVTLVQDGRTGAEAGTSAETTNLGLEVEPGGQLNVNYQAQDLDQVQLGAVRFFAYFEPNADTWNDAPDLVYVAASDNLGESMTLTIPEGVTSIGTVGVVYDTSNPSQGYVTFSGLGYSEPGFDGEFHHLSFLPSENGNGEDENGDEEETENGPPHEGGSAVSEEVRDGGAPPAHSKGKAHGRNGTQPSAPQALGGTV